MKEDLKEFLDMMHKVEENEKPTVFGIDLDDLLEILGLIAENTEEEEKSEEKEEPSKDAKPEKKSEEVDFGDDILFENARKSVEKLKDVFDDDIFENTVKAAAAASKIGTVVDAMFPITYEVVDQYNDALRKLYPLRFRKDFIDEVYTEIDVCADKKLNALLGDK